MTIPRRADDTRWLERATPSQVFLLHAAFCLQLVALDLALRGPSFYATHPRALAWLLASAALLHLVLALPRSRWGTAARAFTALVLGLAITGQAALYRYYHAALDDQVALAARRAWADVRPVVLQSLPLALLGAVAVAALELGLMAAARRWSPVRKPRLLGTAVVVALAAVAGGHPRHGTAEVRTALAAASFAWAPGPPAHSSHEALPPLVSSRARVPSVLLVVTESVRASDWCGGPEEPCPISPRVSALFPDRVPLPEMRSVASYTAISMSSILTGLPQVGPREGIAAAPDLFDLARATREGDRPLSVHYVSSQSPTFFERGDVAKTVDTFVSCDTFLGHETDDIGEAVYGGLDRQVAGECRRLFASLTPPYFALVHLSGTHVPYYFEEDKAVYKPFGHTVNFSGMEDLHRSYQNSILAQDESLAACFEAFLAAQKDRPYLVVFTSDHGEAFGEHMAIHHGQNLYDEQVHVPGFLAFGGGAFSPAETEALESARAAFVTHFDLLPTILDALGVLDHFALEGAVKKLPGRSLLRPAPALPRALPVTNCSAMWQCPLNNWGVFAGDRKLIEQAWDGEWRCLSLRGGEHEEPLAHCQDLVTASHAFFPAQPNGAAN